MSIIINSENEYVDTTARALRVTSVDGGGGGTVARTSSIQRVNTATTTNVAAGAQSYSFTVVSAASAASPTLNGVALPQGYTANFSIVNPGDTLGAIALVTSSGDDVVILKVT